MPLKLQFSKLTFSKINDNPTPPSLVNIGGGYYISAAMKINGTLWTWGANTYGQLGDNTVVYRCVPVLVLGASNCYQAATGGKRTTHAIDNTGKAWGWGYGAEGELGTNSSSAVSTPKAVFGAHTFCKISNGEFHSIALDNHGQAYCWGYWLSGNRGQPLGAVTYLSTPQAIYGTHNFCQISSYGRYSLAIDSSGSGWAWGLTSYLGNNTTASANTPVSIYGTHNFCKISAGQNNQFAIDNNGKAWGWGYGYAGDNTGWAPILTPVAICGNHTFCQIVGLSRGGMALDNHGQAWGWGYNYLGELGNNQTSAYPHHYRTPVAVCGHHTFCKISAAIKDTYLNGSTLMALDNHNNLWGWGGNDYGQLGSGSSNPVSTPIAIIF